MYMYNGMCAIHAWCVEHQGGHGAWGLDFRFAGSLYKHCTALTFDCSWICHARRTRPLKPQELHVARVSRRRLLDWLVFHCIAWFMTDTMISLGRWQPRQLHHSKPFEELQPQHRRFVHGAGHCMIGAHIMLAPCSVSDHVSDHVLGQVPPLATVFLWISSRSLGTPCNHGIPRSVDGFVHLS